MKSEENLKALQVANDEGQNTFEITPKVIVLIHKSAAICSLLGMKIC